MIDQKLAFVFPGQGSQSVGMLAPLADEYSSIQQLFSRASDVLGYDLWALAQSGPQEQLNLTEQTQPLLLTSSVAIWQVWQSLGGSVPALMAGHSLGEYSALVCSGVIDFDAAVSLVRDRGKFMQQAVPQGVGAMSAVLGLDDEVIVSICQDVSVDGNVVEAVNFNSPGQVVVAGSADAVSKAADLLKEAGAKRVAPLPVSAPFHTSLMKPAAEQLAVAIAKVEFQAPTIPIVHNVHASIESDPGKIRQLMVEQTASPVRWTQSIEFMVARGVECVVECGPGKVLSGLCRRIHKPLSASAIETPDALQATLAS
ncbi:ACP S-malonyltransferase [Pseudomonadales bacterium]|nr:ACP S-malonyltransferase [bacterium]MDB4806436.1 ACP S-malonyltransferase [Pseudomonadales bacterium]